MIPGWTTLVAFARLDCVERGWMEDRGRDQRRISATGQQVLGKLKTRCSEGAIDVRHGYLWTPKFKRVLAPTYTPAGTDAKRPGGSLTTTSGSRQFWIHLASEVRGGGLLPSK